jgi:CHC2 zinc finger
MNSEKSELEKEMLALLEKSKTSVINSYEMDCLMAYLNQLSDKIDSNHFVFRCSFHEEKTESCVLNKSSETYHCLSCSSKDRLAFLGGEIYLLEDASL